MDARALTKAALGANWNQPDSLTTSPQVVAAAITAQESSLIPMMQRFSPATLIESEEGKALDIALRPIGAKLAPRMSAAQASAWRDAIVMSLMKWPARVAIAAAKAGVMERYQYGLDDVDAKLHELAAEIDEKQKRALWRLQRLLAAIEQAMNPPAPMIEEQPHFWTAEDIAEANAVFANQGLRIRYRLGAEPGACENYELPRSEAEAEREAARAQRADEVT